MIQATTPTLTLTLPETVDLSTAQTILVTFEQYDTELTKTLNDGVEIGATNNVLLVYLTQEETLLFVPNKAASVQVNWFDNGARIASEIGKVIITPNLIAEVIEP